MRADEPAEVVTLAKMADLTRGSIITGQTASNRPTALDAKTSGRILVGDGTDLVSVAVSGDATLAANGAVTIANSAVTTAKINDGAVTGAKLAAGAGVAALITAGLGNSDSYVKTDNGAQTLLAADPAKDRAVLIMVAIDETFADAGGNQTVVIIGETAATNKFMANTVLVGATAGSVFFVAGTLLATKALLVTLTAAVGAGTGGISVTVLALPTS